MSKSISLVWNKCCLLLEKMAQALLAAEASLNWEVCWRAVTQWRRAKEAPEKTLCLGTQPVRWLRGERGYEDRTRMPWKWTAGLQHCLGPGMSFISARGSGSTLSVPSAPSGPLHPGPLPSEPAPLSLWKPIFCFALLFFKFNGLSGTEHVSLWKTPCPQNNWQGPLPRCHKVLKNLFLKPEVLKTSAKSIEFAWILLIEKKFQNLMLCTVRPT